MVKLSVPFRHEEIPDWDFDKHCTQIIPETVSCRDLGYDVDAFGITKPFKCLTDEAVEICRHIVLHDKNLKKYCAYNRHDIKTSHQHSENTFAYRFSSGVVKFFRQMFSCPKFETYLGKIAGEQVHLWPLEWEKMHINVQEAAEKNPETVPNIAWHKDVATYALLINLSIFPEDEPGKGGDTCLKDAKGNVIPFHYKQAGDTTLIQGSILEHCGMAAINYNKILIASGMGNKDVRRFQGNDVRTYTMYHSDQVNYMKAFTEFRHERILDQFKEMQNEPDQAEREKIMDVVNREFKVLDRSMNTFYDFCQDGQLEPVDQCRWELWRK